MKETKIDAMNVFSTGALVHTKITRWLGRAQMADSELSDDLPPEIIRGIKDLVEDRQILDELLKIKTKALKFINSVSMFFPVDGLFFIPKKYIVEIDTYLKEKKEEYLIKVEEFIKQYRVLIMEYKLKYPQFYDERKYPSEEKLRRKFRFEWSFKIFAAPNEALKDLSPEIYKEEMERFKADVDEMKQNTINYIGNTMLSLINRLNRQCVDGKVNQRTINSINKMLGRFDDVFADYVDRKDMKVVIKNIKKAMTGTDAKEMRNDDEYRNEVSKAINKVTSDLEKLPNVEFDRSIDL